MGRQREQVGTERAERFSGAGRSLREQARRCESRQGVDFEDKRITFRRDPEINTADTAAPQGVKRADSQFLTGCQ